MARVYANLDDDRIEQLDAECEKRDIYRPQFVTEAVELYLDTDGFPKQTIEHLKQERDLAQKEVDDLRSEVEKLRNAHDSEENQKNKFKDKFEKAVQTNDVILAKIRGLQAQGIFARAAGVKRINTDTYDLVGGSK